jgi:hypothetical protein
MALNFNTVRQNLYIWARAVIPSGVPIIFYEPNAPRPTTAYVSLYLNSINAVNQDYSDPEATGIGVTAMRGDRQFTLQVQAYGSDPLTLLEDLRTSLQKQSVLDTLRANGIAFYQSLTINDITELVDSRYERRAQLDILFGIGQIYEDAPGYFSTIEVEEEYINAVDAVVYDETITIPTI